MVDPADATIDLVLSRFPEAFICLPSYLAGGIKSALSDRVLVLVREVCGDVLKYRHRDIADAVICLRADRASVLVSVGNLDPVWHELNFPYFCVILDHMIDLVEETLNDLIHTADWLDQCWLPVQLDGLIKV